MNRRANVNIRIAGMLEFAFSMAKMSLFFWLYLIKKFLFWGLPASFCTLIETVEEVLKGNGKPVRKLFYKNSQNYNQTRMFSLFLYAFFFYAGSFILLPFPDTLPANISLVIKFAFVYLVLLAVILLTFVSFNMVKLHLPVRKAVLYGFFLLMKKFTRSILLLAAFLVITYLSQMNLIFLFFFAPSLYALAAVLILRKLYEDEENPGWG